MESERTEETTDAKSLLLLDEKVSCLVSKLTDRFQIIAQIAEYMMDEAIDESSYKTAPKNHAFLDALLMAPKTDSDGNDQLSTMGLQQAQQQQDLSQPSINSASGNDLIQPKVSKVLQNVEVLDENRMADQMELEQQEPVASHGESKAQLARLSVVATALETEERQDNRNDEPEEQKLKRRQRKRSVAMGVIPDPEDDDDAEREDVQLSGAIPSKKRCLEVQEDDGLSKKSVLVPSVKASVVAEGKRMMVDYWCY